MPMDEEPKEISRRNFLKRTAIGGAGLMVANDILSPELKADAKKEANKNVSATMMGVPFEPRERVQLGIIGVGGRGSSLLRDLLAVENVEVKAICDLVFKWGQGRGLNCFQHARLLLLRQHHC